MQSQHLERREWLGVFGAGVIAAAITALAMPGPANGPSTIVVKSSRAAVNTPQGEGAEKFKELAVERLAGL
jgi:hypothetical protein